MNFDPTDPCAEPACPFARGAHWSILECHPVGGRSRETCELGDEPHTHAHYFVAPKVLFADEFGEVALFGLPERLAIRVSNLSGNATPSIVRVDTPEAVAIAKSIAVWLVEAATERP